MTTEILITLLTSQWDSASASWIDTNLRTTPDLDWGGLLVTAREARVSPLLHVIHHGREWVPTRVRSTLRQKLKQVVHQNLIALKPLAAVLQALNTTAIAHILLKGSALALTLYRSEDLRPMNDVDLLRSAWCAGIPRRTIDTRDGMSG